VEGTLSDDSSETARTLLPRLQYAEAAVVRGHKEQALERFSRLRDQLVRLQATLAEGGDEDVQHMLDFVEYRLGQLQ
jgi:hypothetical protein